MLEILITCVFICFGLFLWFEDMKFSKIKVTTVARLHLKENPNYRYFFTRVDEWNKTWYIASYYDIHNVKNVYNVAKKFKKYSTLEEAIEENSYDCLGIENIISIEFF